MRDTIICNAFGEIEKIQLGGKKIPFRQGFYAGPSLHYMQEGRESKVSFHQEGTAYFASENGICAEKEIRVSENTLCVSFKITAQKKMTFPRLFVRMGIDAYMDSFPSWNDKFFPTMLRAERTHFVGMLQNPCGDMLGLACAQPIISWSLDYNRANYGGSDHVGHRVYTFCLDLYNEAKQPSRHPSEKAWKSGETRTFELYFRIVRSEKELFGFWKEKIGCPLISAEKWTLEQGETIKLLCADGDWTLYSPDHKKVSMQAPLKEIGEYEAIGKKNGKETRARFFVRDTSYRYLQSAAQAAMRYPQKASTHCETYYGYFSAFAYALRSKDSVYLNSLCENFNVFFKTMTDEQGHLMPAADPERVQNISTLLSILALAYETTKENMYLDRAVILAEDLIRSQSEDGAYRCGWNNGHYTCVIYPAKSMFELYAVAKDAFGYEGLARSCYESASCAVENLAVLMDDIQTEGEQTFEDGMISCESLQLALYALLQKDETKKKILAEKAEKILMKHACLEQNVVWDSRVRGCTLRFWETMYDVLINKNMIVSPHGWTSWKIYATYYLYLLTDKEKYLRETMDTLGACMQTCLPETGELRWGYMVDPCVEADVFVPRGDGFGELKKQILGEQYIPMISDWWKSDLETIVKGFAIPSAGCADGVFHGGCCDNDVHEHFKCLHEIGFTAFVHEREDGTFLTYNCTLKENKIEIGDAKIDRLRVFLRKDREMILGDEKISLHKAENIFQLKGGKNA